MERIFVNRKLRGKNLIRSRAACAKRIVDGEMYFLQRGGSWFRPGAHGYTGDISEAGTFNAKTARGYLDVEDMVMIPQSSMRAELWKAMQALLVRASALAKLATE